MSSRLPTKPQPPRDTELDFYVPTSERSRNNVFGVPEPEPVEMPPQHPSIIIQNILGPPGQQAPQQPPVASRPQQAIMPRPWWVGRHGVGWVLFYILLAAGAVWGFVKLHKMGVL